MKGEPVLCEGCDGHKELWEPVEGGGPMLCGECATNDDWDLATGEET